MTSNQHACVVAGTPGRLACVATRGCWHNSKVIHCTKKYWGINTTNGQYEHARQFFSVAMPFCLSCLAPPAVVFALRYRPPQLFTVRPRCSVPSSCCSHYVFALLTRSFCCCHSSCCLLHDFALLTRYFHC